MTTVTSFASIQTFTMDHCTLCGHVLAGGDKCPECGQSARTRSMVPLIEQLIIPAFGASPLRHDLPLLSFALTGHERRVLEKAFHRFKSVSLYGSYGTDHETGVDARDLSRYEENSYGGVFSSLLFDYFVEHEQALAEMYRVLAPGGILLTHIAPHRLLDGFQPSRVHKTITPRADYMSYIPQDAHIVDIRVGRDWFVQAMRNAGFDAGRIVVRDVDGGVDSDWFIAVKPMQEALAPTDEAVVASGGLERAAVAPTQRHIPITAPATKVEACALCGSTLPPEDRNSKYCAGCGQPPRIRSLPVLLKGTVVALLEANRCTKPLLGFSMMPAERAALEEYFPAIKSVSLYGDYTSEVLDNHNPRALAYSARQMAAYAGTSHEVGVDARDLSRYPANAFGAIYSSRLFDYFVEHEAALAEMFRVLEPGGIFMTHISPHRLLPGDNPPRVNKLVKTRPEHMGYVPAEAGMPEVVLGEQGFITAMRRAGFGVKRRDLVDPVFGETSTWFIGIKPAAVVADGEAAKAAAVRRPAVAVESPAPATTSRRKPAVAAAAHQKTYSTPVDPSFGFSRVSVTLSTPELPNGVRFAEHVYDRRAGCSTDQVIAMRSDGVVVSDDLGETWKSMRYPELKGYQVLHCFTLDNGTHLLQGVKSDTTVAMAGKRDVEATIFRCDADWQLLDQSRAGTQRWHGPRAIDQSHETIMYAEYPLNSAHYRDGVTLSEDETDASLCHSPAVYRSRDDGAHWEKVFEVSWSEIRHFHTLIADPSRHGHWWLSSGDVTTECRIWRSVDDGNTWQDATQYHPQFPLASKKYARQAAQRHTDLIVLPDQLIWASDDLLGVHAEVLHEDVLMSERSGSRLFISPQTLPLQPRVLGVIGSPVRSLVDVGPAWLALTEAKYLYWKPRPQVVLISKADPTRMMELFTIDNFQPKKTGFTYSRASRSARDGRFFTYRDPATVFDGGASILQWDIDFH